MCCDWRNRTKSADLRMVLHDLNWIVDAEYHQSWRAFADSMHLHENHYIKRAGVAGIRARAYRKVVEFKSVRCILCFEVHSKY